MRQLQRRVFRTRMRGGTREAIVPSVGRMLPRPAGSSLQIDRADHAAPHARGDRPLDGDEAGFRLLQHAARHSIFHCADGGGDLLVRIGVFQIRFGQNQPQRGRRVADEAVEALPNIRAERSELVARDDRPFGYIAARGQQKTRGIHARRVHCGYLHEIPPKNQSFLIKMRTLFIIASKCVRAQARFGRNRDAARPKRAERGFSAKKRPCRSRLSARENDKGTVNLPIETYSRLGKRAGERLVQKRRGARDQAIVQRERDVGEGEPSRALAKAPRSAALL